MFLTLSGRSLQVFWIVFSALLSILVFSSVKPLSNQTPYTSKDINKYATVSGNYNSKNLNNNEYKVQWDYRDTSQYGIIYEQMHINFLDVVIFKRILIKRQWVPIDKSEKEQSIPPEMQCQKCGGSVTGFCVILKSLSKTDVAMIKYFHLFGIFSKQMYILTIVELLIS